MGFIPRLNWGDLNELWHGNSLKLGGKFCFRVSQSVIPIRANLLKCKALDNRKINGPKPCIVGEDIFKTQNSSVWITKRPKYILSQIRFFVISNYRWIF